MDEGINALWTHVIITAFQDAFRRSGKFYDQKPKLDARGWFERGDKDFQDVCIMAGYEPKTIRDWYLHARKHPHISLHALKMFNSLGGESLHGKPEVNAKNAKS